MRRCFSVHSLLAGFIALSASCAAAHAQAVGVSIEPNRLPNNPTPETMERLDALKAQGRLLTFQAIRDALAKPSPTAVTLPSCGTQPLSATEIADRARQSSLRVGCYYLCNHCNNWHVNIAGGYALTSDGIGATCFHVLHQSDAMMREGYFFAMDASNAIYPITQVLAADAQLDAAIFRMDGASEMKPLPINDQTRPGEHVYLLSDPGGVSGYFSEGMINRFYWNGAKRQGDPTKFADARQLRIDVSTDWAPGSSGAAIVDVCGNVIGHVSKISTLMGADHGPTPPRSGPSTTTQNAALPAGSSAPTHVVLHEATPIRGVKLLIESMNESKRPTETDDPAHAG